MSEIKVAVIGGGQLGLALTRLLAGLGRKVSLWVRSGVNEQAVPSTVHVSEKIQYVLEGAQLVVIAVPAYDFREVAVQLGEFVAGDQCVVHTCRGLEASSAQTMIEVLREETCVLKSGMLNIAASANDLDSGVPTGAVVASRFPQVCQLVQDVFEGSGLRVYSCDDPLGTELAAGMVGCIALATGLCHGLGFNPHIRSLVMTRSFEEMVAYGKVRGASLATFTGMAGLGSMISLCEESKEGPWYFGASFTGGQVAVKETASREALATLGAVAETGGCGMPIFQTAHRVLTHQGEPRYLAERLLALSAREATAPIT